MSGLHKNCLICNDVNLVHQYTINGYHILKCKRCSLLFVGEVVSQEELRRHQNEGDDEFIYLEQGNVDNLKYYYGKLASHILQEKQVGKILDVGCSAGFFLDCMEGWERHGVEMDERYAGMAKSKYGHHIFSGTLEDYPCAEEYFDVITLQDVLDHMPDPLQALRKCNSLLKPGGLIIVKVHNVSCLLARISGQRFYAFVPPVHLVYFNSKNIGEAVMRSGFEVDKIVYIPHLLSLKTIIYRLSHSGRRKILNYLNRIIGESFAGKIRIKKNLHDIVTVFARKP